MVIFNPGIPQDGFCLQITSMIAFDSDTPRWIKCWSLTPPFPYHSITWNWIVWIFAFVLTLPKVKKSYIMHLYVIHQRIVSDKSQFCLRYHINDRL
ncbi:hypothetical protein CEXT_46161 [Caerostris extrusa]|uniref:Uncharacterized protein n=1 Tax=Caerostris extrusa TaxID=172846 RepID=A0AAV4PPJ9_CAEEX|nr:hypothetical protein CEXT_46161 [Caerostris extrusa]